MTIFHVLRHPIPEWPAHSELNQLPLKIREDFLHEAHIAWLEWQSFPISERQPIDTLFDAYTKLYMRILMEYED